jgi:CRP/FNR family transcriptional regulator
MQKIEVLQQLPYFAILEQTNPALLALAETMFAEKYEPNQLLFLEGELCRGLYYLATGRVRIFKSEPNGREQVLRIAEAGTTFNEVPVFDGGLVAANAATLETSLVWVIPTEAILTLLAREPQISQMVIRTLATRLRYLTSLVGEISLKQVTARVARILLYQVEQEPILGKAISNQLTQQQMAAMAGTVREMVGRALRTLQKSGAIEAKRGHISIKDVNKLRTFV